MRAREIASKYLIDVGIQAPTLAVFDEFEDALTDVLVGYEIELLKEKVQRLDELIDAIDPDKAELIRGIMVAKDAIRT